ncbi:hypothetical protein [Streptomyces cupreus]|uniref:Uncharacterized protein n=1 Tax=Streptomyces cupreus TaxID=2759956 RepID=A0A7X1J2S2_9ACTN|nr:hypothetical protein [Streptomyces cupreus]MBC2903163.1 hypothetical protein [Streptomyces cupreus]
MKTAALAADTIRWLCHGATAYGALWVGGSTWPTPVAVTVICVGVGVDYAVTRPLRWASDWLTSNTHV